MPPAREDLSPEPVANAKYEDDGTALMTRGQIESHHLRIILDCSTSLHISSIIQGPENAQTYRNIFRKRGLTSSRPHGHLPRLICDGFGPFVPTIWDPGQIPLCAIALCVSLSPSFDVWSIRKFVGIARRLRLRPLRVDSGPRGAATCGDTVRALIQKPLRAGQGP